MQYPSGQQSSAGGIGQQGGFMGGLMNTLGTVGTLLGGNSSGSGRLPQGLVGLSNRYNNQQVNQYILQQQALAQQIANQKLLQDMQTAQLARQQQALLLQQYGIQGYGGQVAVDPAVLKQIMSARMNQNTQQAYGALGNGMPLSDAVGAYGGNTQIPDALVQKYLQAQQINSQNQATNQAIGAIYNPGQGQQATFQAQPIKGPDDQGLKVYEGTFQQMPGASPQRGFYGAGVQAQAPMQMQGAPSPFFAGIPDPAQINTAQGNVLQAQTSNTGHNLTYQAALDAHRVSQGNNMRTTAATMRGQNIGATASANTLAFNKSSRVSPVDTQIQKIDEQISRLSGLKNPTRESRDRIAQLQTLRQGMEYSKDPAAQKRLRAASSIMEQILGGK
jgi:hypothetical protein